jgi:hypothetical protein
VTVTELLIRQASPARCTDSSPAEPHDDITDTIPVVVAPASHRRPPARGTQFAKLASIGVAGAVLCGAVAVSSMISQQRRENTQSAARPTVQITGDQALLPDRLDRSLPKALVPAPESPRQVPPAVEATVVPTTTPPRSTCCRPSCCTATWASSSSRGRGSSRSRRSSWSSGPTAWWRLCVCACWTAGTCASNSCSRSRRAPAVSSGYSSFQRNATEPVTCDPLLIPSAIPSTFRRARCGPCSCAQSERLAWCGLAHAGPDSRSQMIPESACTPITCR